MKRRRTAPGTRHAWGVAACLLTLVAATLATTALPATSFSTADVDRGSGLDATGDLDGVQRLDTAASVRVNATDPLTNVTNQFGRSVTVTVALRSDSTHLGDLVVDGTVDGNRTSFTLGAGETKRVSIEVPDDGSLVGEYVYFRVSSSAPGLSAETPDRSAEVAS